MLVRLRVAPSYKLLSMNSVSSSSTAISLRLPCIAVLPRVMDPVLWKSFSITTGLSRQA